MNSSKSIYGSCGQSISQANAIKVDWWSCDCGNLTVTRLSPYSVKVTNGKEQTFIESKSK